MEFFDFAAVMLVLAAAVGCANHVLLRLPRSIGVLLLSLMLAAIALAAGPVIGPGFDQWLRQTLQSADLPHVFLDGILAFLLFAGTLHVNFAELRANRVAILLLATGSVVVATVLFGLGLYGLSQLAGAPIPLGWCVVLGAALAPTDAVVVDGLLRRMPLPPAMRAAITGESLFNDGAGVVMFLVTLGIAQGERGVYGHGQIAAALAIASLGGAAVGAVAGFVAALVMRRVPDDGLRLMTSLALVLGSYRVANEMDVSGPIAVVSAGLVLCQMIPDFSHSDGRRSAVLVFWSMLDDLFDTILFLLIGVHVLDLAFSRPQVLLAIAALPLSLASRFLSVAIPAAIAFPKPGPFFRCGALLTWAGLRGGVSVALALTLPQTEYSGVLLTVCYAVVVFSIVVQGLTMPRVLGLLFRTPAPVAPIEGAEAG